MEAKERPSEELTCLSWMFILSVRKPRGDKTDVEAGKWETTAAGI